MGVFSEMNMEVNTDMAEAVSKRPDDSEILAKAEERDDARQQAEADAAQAALAQLAKAECEPDAVESEEDSEAKKRKAHEEAEAKRKAEWEAKKKAREEEELFAWESAVALDDEALITASMKRLGDDAERLTRRNMKQCVTEFVQTLCLEDLNFARQALHPRKTMVRCFRYINRKARAFIEQEMKDNNEKPVNGVYGSDVPDDLCYQWAKEYFLDMDVEEDKEGEEKFVSKPYSGKPAPKSKKKTEKKKTAPKKPEEKASAPSSITEGQMNLFLLTGGAA
jgi:hypothetical protein